MASAILITVITVVAIAITESAILDNTRDKSESSVVASSNAIAKEAIDTHRQQRFFSSVRLKSIDAANELDSPPSALEKIDEDPNTALSGVYSDCLVNLSFPCLQRKILVFLDRLGRMAKFNLIGNFLSVVRTAKESRPPVISSRLDDEHTLRAMIDDSIDKFFDDHVIRVTVPTAAATGRSTATNTVLDFRVGETYSVEEGRNKKKKGGGKMKGMKKMMMMGCMMMMGKAAMLGPLIMGISSLAAIKALIFSTMALTISKIMILKKLKMMMSKGGSSGWSSSGSGGGGGWPSSGSGGGGGWSSGGGGGGGGWSSGGGGDRSFDTHENDLRAKAALSKARLLRLTQSDDRRAMIAERLSLRGPLSKNASIQFNIYGRTQKQQCNRRNRRWPSAIPSAPGAVPSVRRSASQASDARDAPLDNGPIEINA
ncbi:uncharacterized protein LOC128994551 [Macrosteles quadrilineatus]|uniref:uncharacterized protein LOC128994551 n=1 Tax=Macrosteles quadrilineatus TaxID=74068 RepID=UPI0023E249E1|nr:uncharacterized protein LOC128994551 [Macrosteles quadrilineatus]